MKPIVDPRIHDFTRIMVYISLEEYDAAISNSENLIQLLQLTKDRTAMRDAFNTIGNIYFRRG